jgi:hypothetical protein
LLKSLHRSLECITLAKEFNKLKHKTTNKREKRKMRESRRLTNQKSEQTMILKAVTHTETRFLKN